MKTKRLLSIMALCLGCLAMSAQNELWPDTVPTNPNDPNIPSDRPTDPPSGIVIEVDTIYYAKEACTGNVDPSTSSEITFRLQDNTLYIDGSVVANCCGNHYFVFMLMEESMTVQVFDEFGEDEDCDCYCLYPVHEAIEGCNGENYQLFFENLATGSEKKTITLKQEPSVVNGVQSEQAVSITRPDRGLLCVTTSEGGALDLQLYSLSGQLVRTVQGESGKAVDLSSLPSGTYLVTVNGQAAGKWVNL